MVFRLGEGPIFGLRRAKIWPRWRYVGAKLACFGPRLGLCWLLLAKVRAMLGLCWPMLVLSWLSWAKMKPRWGQDGAKMGQDEAKMELRGAMKRLMYEVKNRCEKGSGGHHSRPLRIAKSGPLGRRPPYLTSFG